jgi:hypothetical protein
MWVAANENSASPARTTCGVHKQQEKQSKAVCRMLQRKKSASAARTTRENKQTAETASSALSDKAKLCIPGVNLYSINIIGGRVGHC